MNILDTKLGKDTLAIINSTAKNLPSVAFKATLLSNGKNLELTRVQQHLVSKDYRDNSTVVRNLVVSLTVDEYETYIVNARSDMLVEMYEYPIKANGKTTDNPPLIRRYRAKLLNPMNESLVYGDFAGSNDQQKKDNLKHIGLELTDIVYANFHNVSMSGTVVEGTVNDIIHVFGSNLGEYYMDVYPPNLTKPVKDLVIPDGVKMLHIATWLQNQGCGVYYNDCNVFVEDNSIYVYPISLLDKMENRKKVTIIRCSPNELAGVDTTYSVEGNQIYILSTGNATMEDKEEEREDSAGNAIRWSEPDFLGAKVEHKDGVTANTSRGYYTYAQNQKRETVSVVDQLITSNKCRQISKMNSHRGIDVALPWDNMNEAIIVPNMEVDVYYMESSRLMHYAGVIHGVISEGNRDTDSNEDRFHTSGKLLMRLVPIEELEG